MVASFEELKVVSKFMALRWNVKLNDLKHPFPRSTHLLLLHISCVIVVIEKHDPCLYFYIMDGSKRW